MLHGPSTNVLTNYGPITVFFCEDPDGNQVEVIALPSHEEVKEFVRARWGGTSPRTDDLDERAFLLASLTDHGIAGSPWPMSSTP